MNKKSTQIKLLPGEKIKSVIGYEGIYSITSEGRVYSHKKNQGCYHNGKFLLLQKSKSGYLKVTLAKNATRKQMNIHRLVAIHFVENQDNKECVNHIDGDKENNSINNLEWVTYKENTNHAYETGLIDRKKVYRIDSKGNKKIYNSATEAAKYNNSYPDCICRACNGIRKTAGGYKWEYV